LLDLQLFLDRKLVFCNTQKTVYEPTDLVYGALPQDAIDQKLERVKQLIQDSSNLVRRDSIRRGMSEMMRFYILLLLLLLFFNGHFH
jgi:hypothetical protein